MDAYVYICVCPCVSMYVCVVRERWVGREEFASLGFSLLLSFVLLFFFPFKKQTEGGKMSMVPGP